MGNTDWFRFSQSGRGEGEGDIFEIGLLHQKLEKGGQEGGVLSNLNFLAICTHNFLTRPKQ